MLALAYKQLDNLMTPSELRHLPRDSAESQLTFAGGQGVGRLLGGRKSGWTGGSIRGQGWERAVPPAVTQQKAGSDLQMRRLRFCC